LLDTISNIFAADKKTFTVLEDVTAHYFLPPCIDNIVLPIYETEISSFVAYTLMSSQYQQSVSDLTAKELNKDAAGVNGGAQSVPAAVASNNTNVNNVDQSSEGLPKDAASAGNDVSKSSTGKDTTFVPVNEDPNKERDEILKGLTTSFNSTVDCNFKQDYRAGQTIKVKLKTTVYFAQHFEWLRRLIGVDESQFIASMSRSKIWDAKGGKSRSWFSKTLDDRWILKGIAAVELESFLQFAPQYFDYLSKVYFQQVPTALAKIVGVYSVIYKRGNKSLKQDFLVMENLFYKRSISKIYDLKGSLRSRYVNVEEEKAEGPVVLLDENLLETIYSNPICVREESKATLGMTIWNDTLFLSSLNVMDYSLLVGVDEEKNELVVGIIDYMRRYTWDKQLETWVKRTGFLGDGNKVPTIISPKQYKKRFRSALWLYFPMVPTKDTSVVSFSAQK
jgi:1-phosphatidylinositol-3-phosphate 5-kinase